MFYTVKNAVTGDIKILRSQFIALLYPVSNAEEARMALSEHVKRYADATHNCYAYICGLNQETSYYADAGEPGGTAGKPILNALLRNNISNTLAVVTRYYGGIKLGVKGLIDAYTEAVEAAIEKAELVPAREYLVFEVSCDYPVYEAFKHKATEYDASFDNLEYAAKVNFEVAVPGDNAALLIEILDGYRLQTRLCYNQKISKD